MEELYSEAAFKAAAKAAKLRYVHDTEPGITRTKKGDEYHYHAPDGARVTVESELERINALGIPPAYDEVWICTRPNGHLQATGRDAKRRKQYRYHPKWQSVRSETKFQHMAEFGAALPALRTRITTDMAARQLTRERVLATIAYLMDHCFIRIGNAQYAKENESYGLTTLQKDHAEVAGTKLTFAFKGKSGKMWNVQLRDRRVASTIKKLEDLDGQDLFQYLDEAGVSHKVTSDDVNRYLQDIAAAPFTAKDFRTWAATSKAIAALAAWEFNETKKEQQAHLKATVKAIAEELGHTPAICRKCYIHPQVIEHFTTGQLHTWHRTLKAPDPHTAALEFLAQLS